MCLRIDLFTAFKIAQTLRFKIVSAIIQISGS